jgi:hypothetical protein
MSLRIAAKKTRQVAMLALGLLLRIAARKARQLAMLNFGMLMRIAAKTRQVAKLT